jgi:Sulfotransferase family
MPASGPADPVFVGGAARSGLQAVARLVGAHQRYRYLDAQVRFHADDGGLPDLLASRVEIGLFLERLRGHWWFHTRAEERGSGLHQLVPRADFDRAVGEFERSFTEDQVEAARQLVRSMLDPLARADGASSWVEWSTRSLAAAPTLAELFPDCRMIHVVRDGRDVACSLVSLPWAPDSVVNAVAGWQRQVRVADVGARELGPERVLTLNIADLAIDDREPSYDRLLDFLGIEDDTGMREHFENKLLPGAANPGRWEIDLDEYQQHELERAYDQALRELADEGVEIAVALRRRRDAEGAPTAPASGA